VGALRLPRRSCREAAAPVAIALAVPVCRAMQSLLSRFERCSCCAAPDGISLQHLLVVPDPESLRLAAQAVCDWVPVLLLCICHHHHDDIVQSLFVPVCQRAALAVCFDCLF
jgi:hypothetical protein